MTAPVELIAPAGNMQCARAAVANGASAVYFGLQQFNARMRADNFTEHNLPELVEFLHAHHVRAFCAFNTLVFTDELPAAEQQLRLLDAAGVDVVIVQDLGLARLAQELGIRCDIHASTQMTITSPEGVAFAARLGIKRVVLARETSLRELAKFGDLGVELETFVHGALCVAYSGQCLTSEALGQRSANRGECAQACRLPYELIVDGAPRDLGDRRYLLSPQDLAAVAEVPELIKLGVRGFKIEGRLKTPEYVAATCQVYRRAIDAALGAATVAPPDAADHYKLEMTFSRGFYSGWLRGVNHQQLVHARFGTKRGPFVGKITAVGPDYVAVASECALQPGDGVGFDTGGDTDREQGGRIWEIKGDRLFFERGHLDFNRLTPGDRVWKTSDPRLERELRRTFRGELPRPAKPLDLTVTGQAGGRLCVIAGAVRVESAMALQPATNRPLTDASLRAQLGRLGGTGYELRELRNELAGAVIVPVSELNRLRRELVAQFSLRGSDIPVANPAAARPRQESRPHQWTAEPVAADPSLAALCRTMDQISVALAEGCATIYVDFEDLRRYPAAVELAAGKAAVFLATPRIQKAGEQGFFHLIENAKPDGVLIRNLGGLDYFRTSPLRKLGDFSLNVTNPLTAEWLMNAGLERLTISYDLNARQVLDLAQAAPPDWWELVLHQHLPMFHMEHCVFAAFLSNGTDHTNCGRPCDHHRLQLRDRVGVAHPIKADVGCRNTVFHAKAQSGAEFLPQFLAAGLHRFRVELLEEDAAQTREVIATYRQLLTTPTTDAAPLLRRLQAARQLGVTSGTLTVLG